MPILGVKVEAVNAQLQKVRGIGAIERLEPVPRTDRRGKRPYRSRLISQHELPGEIERRAVGLNDA